MKASGPAEADETFIGGSAKNMLKARKAKVVTGTGGFGKAVVMEVLRRGNGAGASKVVAKHIADTGAASLHPVVKATVEAGSQLYTDTHKGYRRLSPRVRAWCGAYERP